MPRPDRKLRLRMLAVLLGLLGLPLAVVAVVALVETEMLLYLVVAIVVGGGLVLFGRRKEETPRELTREDAPEAHAALDRLCVAADERRPPLCVVDDPAPNAYVTGVLPRRQRIVVTQVLLERLSPEQVEAVLAHELAHIRHSDATVMSVAGGVGVAMLAGLPLYLQLLRTRFTFAFGICLIVPAALIGFGSRFLTLALSRQREFAADEGAAAMTGRPAALAAALLALEREAATIPTTDLRLSRSAFLTLGKTTGFMATHPCVADRVAALERYERAMHGTR